MSAQKKELAIRKTFRHGDLHRALLEAGIELAREGGPGAIALREVTRRAGVAPNAAYRHFASHGDLVRAVRAAALALLARSIEAEMAAVKRGQRRAGMARGALRAVGMGYLKFAFAETGLFRTAFSMPGGKPGEDPAMAGPSGLTAFQLLGQALDRMVEAEVLPAKRRAGAEYLAWSAVHGLAFLVLDGPMRGMPSAEVEVLAERLLLVVENGL